MVTGLAAVGMCQTNMRARCGDLTYDRGRSNKKSKNNPMQSTGRKPLNQAIPGNFCPPMSLYRKPVSYFERSKKRYVKPKAVL
jgi:hypothetical protein